VRVSLLPSHLLPCPLFVSLSVLGFLSLSGCLVRLLLPVFLCVISACFVSVFLLEGERVQACSPTAKCVRASCLRSELA